jgi:hypothetical protein
LYVFARTWSLNPVLFFEYGKVGGRVPRYEKHSQTSVAMDEKRYRVVCCDVVVFVSILVTACVDRKMKTPKTRAVRRDQSPALWLMFRLIAYEAPTSESTEQTNALAASCNLLP